MKRIIQLIICLVALNMGATKYSSLEYLSMDFSESTDGYLYEGWTCWGMGKTPVPEVTETFNIKSGDPAYTIIGVGELFVPFSNSTTVEGGPVSEWLVSPAVTLPVDDVVLSFYVAAFGTNTNSEYEIYVSTTGNTPDCFTEQPVYTGTIKGHDQYAQTEMIYVPLNGYKNKTINVAFVNKSEGSMLTGFTNITIADYAVNLTNRREKFVYESGDYSLPFVAQIMTPMECLGFKATLKTDTGIVSEYEETKDLSGEYKSYSFEFPVKISLPDYQTVDYTITLTPNYPEAKSIEMKYSISYTKAFKNIVVMENATGAWNPYATFGCAAIDKYCDTYPDQFIPIEVHYSDAMQVDNYSPYIFTITEGLSPLAVLNRSIVTDTWDENTLKKLLKQNAPMQVEIKETYFDTTTKRGRVKYAPQFGVDISDIDLTAVVVVREDKCSGSGKEWTQMNNLSGAKNPTQVGVSMDWWPYLKYYCQESMEIRGFEFAHVGWGIFNDFNGSGVELPKVWKADEPQELTLSFDLPENIQNIDNTSVVVMIIEKETGKVITASDMYADKYSSIENIGSEDEYKVSLIDKTIFVEAEQGAIVDIFDTRGVCLGRHQMNFDTINIDLNHCSELILVRINKGNKTFIKKIICKG